MPPRTGNKGSRAIGAVSNMPRLSNALTIREKRTLQNRLLNSQEAAERAVEVIEDVALDCYEAGMSYNTIGGILSIHGTTTKDMCDRAHARRAEQGSQSRR